MRLLALADAHQRRGGRALFALNRAAEPLRGDIRRRGHDVAMIGVPSGSIGDQDATRELVRQRGAAGLVLDGSFATLRFERDLSAHGAAVITIDDSAGRATAADILVNPNGGASQASYPEGSGTRLLLGPRYALLRPEFAGAARRAPRRPAGPAPCLLISFGASDPARGTARVLAALPVAPALRLLVVVGAHHERAGEVFAAAERAASAGHTVEILHAPPDMAHLMGIADAAISAAGGTLLELACVGCPALAFAVADNQRSGARALVEAGCAAGGDDLRELDDSAVAGVIARFLADSAGRETMAERGRRVVDGLGAGRVLSALEQILSGPTAPIEATP
jgi:spore coat polysaccharide biosynthesis predicted glycosyltransferase SpsG